MPSSVYICGCTSDGRKQVWMFLHMNFQWPPNVVLVTGSQNSNIICSQPATWFEVLFMSVRCGNNHVLALAVYLNCPVETKNSSDKWEKESEKVRDVQIVYREEREEVKKKDRLMEREDRNRKAPVLKMQRLSVSLLNLHHTGFIRGSY